jgi:hypothetical protein
MFKHVRSYSRFILLESKQDGSSFLKDLNNIVTELTSKVNSDEDCVRVTEELKEYIDQNKNEHIFPNLSNTDFIIEMLEILKTWKEKCIQGLANYEISSQGSYDDFDDFETSSPDELNFDDLESMDMEDDPFEA